MSRRRRSRGRGSGPSLLSVALLLGVALLVVTAGTPTVAFTSATFDRGSAATVADDANGLLALDVAGSVSAGSSSRLVTVTNQLDRPLDVTVVPENASVTLSNAQATLDPGESLTTSATVSCDFPADSVFATVTAVSGSAFSATATRSTTVDTNGCKDSTLSSGVQYVSGTASADDVTDNQNRKDGVKFQIKNNGSSSKSIIDMKIETSSADRIYESSGPAPYNHEVDIDTEDTGGYADEGPAYIIGTNVSQDYEDDGTFETDMKSGETAQVHLYQFQSESGNSGNYNEQDMTGSSITITIYFTDGSTTSFQINV